MIVRLLPVAVLLLLPAVAHGQQLGPKGINPVVSPTDNTRKSERAPPALPGARADQNPIAPSDRPTNDMQPNDALFDAINRGDLPVARDALNRGADLSATNVLGLTPLELSIDLGRNDISFLLLSLKGASGPGSGRPPGQPGAGVAEAPPTPAQRRAQLAAERRAQLLADRQARAEATAIQPAPTTQTPPLFAGNGGTPNPQAGFVGFGR